MPAIARCLSTFYMPPMTEDDRPLLLFDSGVGGLSVLRAVTALLPQAPIIYVADNGGFPYGTKTEAEIATRVPALLGRLTERYHPRLIVIACNTASTIALGAARAALDLPIVGTVPAIKPAAALSKTRVIGVLGTNATVRQPYVNRLSEEFASDCLVLRHGSARLVELVEAKLRGEPAASEDFRAALDGLLDQPGGERIDTVVLACTHFPLVAEELEAVSPQPIRFMDGAEGIARRVAVLTDGQAWPAQRPPGIAVFTAPADLPSPLVSTLAGYGLARVEFL